jgi:hypothetical protein
MIREDGERGLVTGTNFVPHVGYILEELTENRWERRKFSQMG